MVSDIIGDFIIRLKNAGAVGKTTTTVPYSQLRHAIADKLCANGYLEKVEVKGKTIQSKVLELTLKYNNAKHVINGVKRISKPGRRLYVGVAGINPVKFGKGHLVLSTPAGILTGEEAKEKNVGGEQLFMIW